MSDLSSWTVVEILILLPGHEFVVAIGVVSRSHASRDLQVCKDVEDGYICVTLYEVESVS